MLEENLDWPRIEEAANAQSSAGDLSFDLDARRAISAALVKYVDESAAPSSVSARRGVDPAAAAIDPMLARRIQHHIAALCEAANLNRRPTQDPATLDIDVAALDRETSELTEVVAAAVQAARDSGPPVTTSFAAFTRFVLRIAAIYEAAGGAVERIAKPSGRGRKKSEIGRGEPEVTLDRAFVKFLRILLQDAEEVLLGLPEEPALRRSDGSFARRTRSALARRTQ